MFARIFLALFTLAFSSASFATTQVKFNIRPSIFFSVNGVPAKRIWIKNFEVTGEVPDVDIPYSYHLKVNAERLDTHELIPLTASVVIWPLNKDSAVGQDYMFLLNGNTAGKYGVAQEQSLNISTHGLTIRSMNLQLNTIHMTDRKGRKIEIQAQVEVWNFQALAAPGPQN